MIEKHLFLQPGDTVRITMDRGDFIEDRPDDTYLIGTKGSTGKVVSYEEFHADYEQRLGSYSKSDLKPYERYFSGVREGMESGRQYPVRFETVEPTTIPDAVVCCSVGKIELLDIYVLEKLNFIDSKTLFTVNSLRAILPGGDDPLQPPKGCKLLRIGFTIECQDTTALRLRSGLNAQLRIAGVGNSLPALPPLRLEWAEGGKLAGQAAFLVPERASEYEFSLEIPSVGSGITALKIPCLLPGDEVSLVENTTAHFHDPAHSRDYSLDLLHLVFPTGTQGSTGTIVTFTRYRADYELRMKHGQKNHELIPAELEAYENILAGIREEIETGFRCAVRLTRVIRSNEKPVFPEDGFCKTYEIYLFSTAELKRV